MKALVYLSTFFFLTNFCCGQHLTISGTITDKKDNHVIKKAEVSLYNDKDSLLSTIKTDKKGFYQFKASGPSTFHIKVEKKKYSSRIIKDIRTSLTSMKLDIAIDKYFEVGIVY